MCLRALPGNLRLAAPEASRKEGIYRAYAARGMLEFWGPSEGRARPLPSLLQERPHAGPHGRNPCSAGGPTPGDSPEPPVSWL